MRRDREACVRVGIREVIFVYISSEANPETKIQAEVVYEVKVGKWGSETREEGEPAAGVGR